MLITRVQIQGFSGKWDNGEIADTLPRILIIGEITQSDNEGDIGSLFSVGLWLGQDGNVRSKNRHDRLDEDGQYLPPMDEGEQVCDLCMAYAPKEFAEVNALPANPDGDRSIQNKQSHLLRQLEGESVTMEVVQELPNIVTNSGNSAVDVILRSIASKVRDDNEAKAEDVDPEPVATEEGIVEIVEAS
jgi:hypothetical protein